MNPRIWLMAARPRTLPAAIAPVLVGSAAAWWAANDACESVADARPERPGYVLVFCDPTFRWGAFFAALIGSIFIQIGTNLANDYSDAKRGADTADRLGPVRVTSAGLVAPRRVLYATWLAFGIAVIAGHLPRDRRRPDDHRRRRRLDRSPASSTPAGPRPYGYAGMGELFVFLFFGLVAVNGSYYVQLEELDWLPFWLSVSVGLLSTAILVVNNVRDIETDRRAGKRTLAVRLGRERTRVLYEACVGGAFVVLAVGLVAADGPLAALIGLFAAPLAIKPLRAVLERTDGPALNGALAGTGALLGRLQPPRLARAPARVLSR